MTEWFYFLHNLIYLFSNSFCSKNNRNQEKNQVNINLGFFLFYKPLYFEIVKWFICFASMVGMPGLDPGTLALKGPCSTNWATFPSAVFEAETDTIVRGQKDFPNMSRADNIQKCIFVEFIFKKDQFFLCISVKKTYTPMKVRS